MGDRSTKYYSSRQEKSISSKLGWRVVVGSGARDCHPGDIRSSEWLGECKTHTAPGTKIQFLESVWKKIEDEATSQFLYPVLFVDDGSQRLDRTYCMLGIIPESDDVRVVPYPYSLRSKNIAFYHEDMNAYIKNRITFYSDIVQAPAIFLEVKVSETKSKYITTLENFSYFFGDN